VAEKTDFVAKLTGSPVAGETYRHKRRGGTYTVVGRATLQAGEPVGDNQELVVYLGEDGQLWARSSNEFLDGRFEKERNANG
jgi:hypothetical protein